MVVAGRRPAIGHPSNACWKTGGRRALSRLLEFTRRFFEARLADLAFFASVYLMSLQELARTFWVALPSIYVLKAGAEHTLEQTLFSSRLWDTFFGWYFSGLWFLTLAVFLASLQWGV